MGRVSDAPLDASYGGVHISSVRAAGHKTEGQDGAAKTTLGDLLYTNAGKVYETEDDWVRLVQSIAAGDQVALHSLYEQTHRLVFTLILRITNNPETAEELTVDVFHQVWRRAPAYDPAAGPVVGWIMNQARSRAIDRVRYEHRKKRTNPVVDEPLATIAPNDPEEACEIQEQNRIVRNALTVLTPEER